MRFLQGTGPLSGAKTTSVKSVSAVHVQLSRDVLDSDVVGLYGGGMASCTDQGNV